MGTTRDDDGAEDSRPLRVLALDGGAIRGYYTARVLERLIVRAGCDPARADLGAQFDLIVGTSAGAILGAALAAGVAVARVCGFYRAHGPAIFPDPSPAGWTAFLWGMRHWRTPPADARALRRALEEALGRETFGGLYGRRRIALCVTATDVATSRGRVFGTPHRSRYEADGELALVDACLASAAAPTLLPPAAIGADGGERWCDGGVWAATPLWAALVEALALAPDRPIDIVSIGTCPVPLGTAVTRERGKALGFWTRGLRALQVSSDAQTRATLALVRELLPRLGARVQVLRLPDPEPDAEQAAELRLDNPSPAAFAAMDALAERAVELGMGGDGEARAPAELLMSLASLGE